MVDIKTIVHLLYILNLAVSCGGASFWNRDWDYYDSLLTLWDSIDKRSKPNSGQDTCIPEGGVCNILDKKKRSCCSSCRIQNTTKGVCAPAGQARSSTPNTKQPEFVTSRLYGHASETSFNDFDTIGSSGISTPKSINVRYAGWVDSIQVTYQTASSVPRQAPRRGGTGGGDCKFELDVDEKIVKVEGAFYNHMDYLQFTTNKNRRSPRCGGGRNDNYFKEQHTGYVLSYISGYYGWYLNGIKFHWVHEEIGYIMSSVRYDVSHVANQQLGQPKVVYSTTLVNKSPVDQKQIVTRTVTTSQTDTWTMDSSLTAGISSTITTGVPLIAEVGVTYSTSATFGFSYGESVTLEASDAYTLEAIVPAMSKLVASLVVFEGSVEVPYTTDLIIKYADGSQVTKPGQTGIFTGVQASSVHAEYGPAIPL